VVAKCPLKSLLDQPDDNDDKAFVVALQKLAE
jgi:hypothetical protein